MGSVRDDQLIYAYLSKVADAAHGKLPSLARQDLVEKVRHDIESRRDPSGRTDITRVLNAMGDPRQLVARAMQEGGTEYAGYRPPVLTASAAQPTAAPDSTQPLPPVPPPANIETTTAVGVTVRPRTTEVIRSRMTPNGPMTWLRIRRAEQPTQVWHDASGTGEFPAPSRAPTTLQPVSIARTYGLELAALFSLTVGALWMPYLGWLVGLLLVAWSRAWSIRDRGIAIALIPAITLGTGIFYVWLTVGRDHPADVTVSERFDEVSGYVVGVFKAWPIVASLLAATWLMAQLLARWAGAQRERWR